MRLVLLGPPGAGKGTLAAKLAARFGLRHFSTGDLLRAEIKATTGLGEKVKAYVEQGRLVPGEIMEEVVRERLAGEDDFILDGYPRTVGQAAFLANSPGTAPDAVIYVAVPEEEAVRRLLGRRVCGSCGAVTNAESEGDGVCERCGGEFVVRADDRRETVRERLHVFLRETAPLVSYYRERGLLREIDGTGPREAVWARLEGEVAPLAARRDDNH